LAGNWHNWQYFDSLVSGHGRVPLVGNALYV
jgi:hypothetical protein